MVIFQYNLYIFCLDITRLTNTVYAMDPNNSVIKRSWCTFVSKQILRLLSGKEQMQPDCIEHPEDMCGAKIKKKVF